MQDAASGFQVRGVHVLIAVIAFFGVIIAVDGTFMAMAFRTYPGEVSVTPYEDGLAYNRRIAQHEAQARLGWRMSAEVRADGAVAVTVVDAQGAPLGDLTVTGDLQRPATEAGRRPLDFAPDGAGRYVARTAPTTGAWDLAVRARDGEGRRFEAERRLTWP